MDAERTLIQSFEDLRDDLKRFLETRYQMLRLELTGGIKRASGAAVLFGAAAVFAVVGVIMGAVCVALTIALAFGIFSNQVGLIWGFLACGAGCMVVAGIGAWAGRQKLRVAMASMTPDRTLHVLRRDQEVLQKGGSYAEPPSARRRA